MSNFIFKLINDKVLLRDAVDMLGSEIIGKTLWDKYHRWAMFSKFFDNAGPLPHHIHHRDRHAERVGSPGKPEMSAILIIRCILSHFQFIIK